MATSMTDRVDMEYDPNQEWLDKIEEMRSSGEFEWADETLTSIYDQCFVRKRITEGQKRAIRNIAGARDWEIDLA